ncbi:hypothetical protein [Chitinophaga sp. YIM B06452]|uniref:hypothetical protein n=1 Tax=Chitinophaga sp. YIM B06452 TaxID=3082158 RepID=UPI0031FE8C0C
MELKFSSEIPSVLDFTGRVVNITGKYNPLALLSLPLLESIISKGHSFFVFQTFPRGFSGGSEAYLLTMYKLRKDADQHYNVLDADPGRLLFSIPEDTERLREIAAQGDTGRIFVPLLKEKGWRPPFGLLERVNRFLRGKGKRGVAGDDLVNLDVEFGRLMVRIYTGKDEVSVPLEELERL